MSAKKAKWDRVWKQANNPYLDKRQPNSNLIQYEETFQ